MPEVIEFTDQELANPALAFQKLAAAVGAVPWEVARVVPDYRDELKHIKTAVQAIQEKPVLEVGAKVLEEAARQGAQRGTGEAVTALQGAAVAYRQTQEREASLIEKVEGLSWHYHLMAAAVFLFLGLAGGFMLASQWERPSVTLDAEKVAAVLVEKFPGICSAKVPAAKR